jgi:uncharacterized protein
LNVLDHPKTMVMPDGFFSWVAEPRGTIVRVPTISLRHARGFVGRQVTRLATAPGPAPYAVTAVMTLACQARCGYCFENKVVKGRAVERVSSETMKPAIIKQLCIFAAKMMEQQRKTTSHVELFGGEPLINLRGCLELLEGMPNLVSASMTTNGVLLTREIALELAARKLHDIQITFDGEREYHDRVRMMADGRGTYDEILRGLEAIDDLDVIPDRGLRIHVSPANIGGIHRLLDDLAARITPGKYGMNLAPLYDVGAGYDGDQLTNSDAEAQLFIELYQYADSLGFLTVPPAESPCSYCSGKFGAGGAVVDTNGTLVSCWDKVGRPDWSVGNIWGGYKDPTDIGHLWTACGVDVVRERIQPILRDDVRWALFELAVAQYKRQQSRHN